MGKVFFDVFPTLQLNPDVSELLADVEVTKITTNKEKSSLRIYIDSRRLIHKKSIYYMEDSIATQFFPGNGTSIKVVENYHLSEQYTPEKLLESYKDSILTELRSYNAIEYSLFKKADTEFTEESVLQLTLEDSVVAREKAEELAERDALRREYIDAVKANLTAQLDNTYIQTPDGKKRKLERK